MARLKKLSKSSTPTTPEFEVLPHDRPDGTRLWLWACEQGCYDGTAYDKTSRDEALKLAQRHSMTPHL